MKYEIEIEGLDPEWEPVRFGVIRTGDSYLGEDGKIWKRDRTSVQEFGLILRRKVSKYDWSKTLDDVLVEVSGRVGIYTLEMARVFGGENNVMNFIWQPNIHGKCPVDGEACHVKLKFSDGHEWHGKASEYEWSHPKDETFPALIAWQFIRLVDGVEW